MFGLDAMMGGGGMSASSSANATNDTNNNVSTGTISIGGLTMGSKSDSDQMKLLIVGAVVLGGIWMVTRKK